MYAYAAANRTSSTEVSIGCDACTHVLSFQIVGIVEACNNKSSARRIAGFYLLKRVYVCMYLCMYVSE